MHHQVETNLSNAASNTGILDWISASDVIAVIAVGVSFATWRWSRSVEERIRADGDERSKFDITFGNPLTTRLELLEGVIAEFGCVVLEETTPPAIAAAMSAIQKHQHTEWYFGVDSFLRNSNQPTSGQIDIELNAYWDQSGHLIDEISNATIKDQAVSNFRQLQSLSDGFLSQTRELLVDSRRSINSSGTATGRKSSWWRG